MPSILILILLVIWPNAASPAPAIGASRTRLCIVRDASFPRLEVRRVRQLAQRLSLRSVEAQSVEVSPKPGQSGMVLRLSVRHERPLTIGLLYSYPEGAVLFEKDVRVVQGWRGFVDAVEVEVAKSCPVTATVTQIRRDDEEVAFDMGQEHTINVGDRFYPEDIVKHGGSISGYLVVSSSVRGASTARAEGGLSLDSVVKAKRFVRVNEPFLTGDVLITCRDQASGNPTPRVVVHYAYGERIDPRSALRARGHTGADGRMRVSGLRRSVPISLDAAHVNSLYVLDKPRTVEIPRAHDSINVELLLRRQTAAIVVRTRPVGANVYIDGHWQGKTSGSFHRLPAQVPVGKHSFAAYPVTGAYAAASQNRSIDEATREVVITVCRDLLRPADKKLREALAGNGFYSVLAKVDVLNALAKQAEGEAQQKRFAAQAKEELDKLRGIPAELANTLHQRLREDIKMVPHPRDCHQCVDASVLLSSLYLARTPADYRRAVLALVCPEADPGSGVAQDDAIRSVVQAFKGYEDPAAANALGEALSSLLDGGQDADLAALARAAFGEAAKIDRLAGRFDHGPGQRRFRWAYAVARALQCAHTRMKATDEDIRLVITYACFRVYCYALHVRAPELPAEWRLHAGCEVMRLARAIQTMSDEDREAHVQARESVKQLYQGIRMGPRFGQLPEWLRAKFAADYQEALAP